MTFDSQIQSITQDEIVPKVTDQTLSSNVGTLMYMSDGRPWAGELLKFPVKMSNGSNGGTFSDLSEFAIGVENVRQTAYFDPRGYYQSVTLGGIARSVNNISKTQVLALVKVEMESALQDMTDDIGSLTYGDATTDSNAFLGLDACIDDGGTVASYGGLSSATYAVWASTIQTSVGAFDFSKARTLMNSASVGNRKPDILTCNETVFGYVESDYAATVEGNYSVVEANRAVMTRNGIKRGKIDGLKGQAGFDVLYYGGSPIVKDDKEDSGTLRAQNTEYFRWYGVKAVDATPVDLKAMYHNGNDYEDGVPSSLGFNWTGFVRPSKQYVFVGQFLVIGNYCSPTRRLHSKSTGITS